MDFLGAAATVGVAATSFTSIAVASAGSRAAGTERSGGDVGDREADAGQTGPSRSATSGKERRPMQGNGDAGAGERASRAGTTCSPNRWEPVRSGPIPVWAGRPKFKI